MKIADVRDMENQALMEEIDRLEKDIMHLRMANTIGTSENPVEIRSKRRDVARIKTVLRQRELEQG
jgi:large subunit ribosomal protein L29